MERYDRCVIICAGDMDISSVVLKENDYIIAADGGWMYCDVLGISPHLILGDFDSLDEKYLKKLEILEKEELGRVIRLKPEKDDTDTLAAIRRGLQAGCREFHLYGASGGRLEHTIANLQCLLFIKKNGGTGYIWDASSMATVIYNESVSFLETMEGMLSIFAVGGDAEGVNETGLKYSLKDAHVTGDFPIGVSNEFVGKKATVSVKKGFLLIIARWE